MSKKDKGKKYAFKTEQSIPPKDKYCHYSGLPSPSAYGKNDQIEEENTDNPYGDVFEY